MLFVPTLPDETAVIGAREVFTLRQRVVLFAAFALLVAYRLPGAWVHGRFLDEEATVFLAYAWHHPWLDALFRPFAGYLNLGANATTVLVVQLVRAGILPLERAPYATMTMALAVQLLPAVLILTGRTGWLADRRAVVAALLVIAFAPASEEVFFNVLHIQFHLALCAGIILALDPPERRAARIGYGMVLFLAPLCGPGAIVVLPLFALRAAVDRDRQRLEQVAAFGAGAAVQLLCFYGASPLRGHLQDPATIAAAMFVRMVALPAFNMGNADRIGAAIHASQVSGGHGWWLAAAAAGALLGALLVTAARRRDAALWLVLAALFIGAASLGFGMVIVSRVSLFTVEHGERYNFLPLALLGLALIALAMRRSEARPVWSSLCGLMLLTGAICYFRPLPPFAEGASWPAEVAAWRHDHNHPLAVWPAPWAADLSDRAKPCSPPGTLPRQDEPRYCEGGWVTGLREISRAR